MRCVRDEYLSITAVDHRFIDSHSILHASAGRAAPTSACAACYLLLWCCFRAAFTKLTFDIFCI